MIPIQPLAGERAMTMTCVGEELWAHSWAHAMSYVAGERMLRLFHKHQQRGLDIEVKAESLPRPSLSPPMAWIVPGPSLAQTEWTLPPREPTPINSRLALARTWAMTEQMTKSECHSGPNQLPARGIVHPLTLSLEAENRCQLVSSASLKNSPASDSDHAWRGLGPGRGPFIQHPKPKEMPENSIIKINYIFMWYFKNQNYCEESQQWMTEQKFMKKGCAESHWRLRQKRSVTSIVYAFEILMLPIVDFLR